MTGIDLLRIVAMGFVIVLHLTGVGGICAGAAPGTPQFYLAQFFRMATFCAVNCYALISGFVGWSRRPKLSGLLRLWLKVIGFCLLITVFARLRDPAAVGPEQLWQALMPVDQEKYWYFNAYVGMFFFLPLLNHGIRGIRGREAVFAMGGIGLMVFVLPFSGLKNSVVLSVGYSALWLMILYLLGGLMSRFEIPAKLPVRGWAGLFAAAVAMGYLPRMGLLLLRPELWSPEQYNLAMQYTNPSAVLAGAALVGLFARLELPGGMRRVTRALAPHSFGVYLLHTHPLIFRTAIRGRFAFLATAPVWELPAVVLGAAAVIYGAGTAADWLLERGMKLLGVERLLKKLDGAMGVLFREHGESA